MTEDELNKQARDKIKKPQLIENQHYYIEGGFMVFTALYHTERGYCCNSGCRHCPYGYKK